MVNKTHNNETTTTTTSATTTVDKNSSNNNSTKIIKTYDKVKPHLIEGLNLGNNIPYSRGDKLVFECNNPSDNVQSLLYIP